MRYSERIKRAYYDTLNSSTRVNREYVAENAAMETALTIVMERHGVTDPYKVTQEMANEARQRYLSAVVGVFFEK